MTTNQTGVAYTTTLPLSWREAVNIAPGETERWQHANISLLHALATVEAMPADREKELGLAAKAYERLETKVDVMLDMLGRLLAERIEIPPEHLIILRANGLEWLDMNAPETGSEIVICLYLSPKLPQPLTLTASVQSCAQEGDSTRVQCVFTHLNAEITEWLERTVFRYHRRSVHHMQAH